MSIKENKNSTPKEVASYLIFGVLTTVVAMATYFGTLWLGEYILAIDPLGSDFYYVRLAAEILQWIVAVIFAFFTNKKWVFTNADQNTSTMKQLTVFAGGRLITLGLDTLITFGTVWALQSSGYVEFAIDLLINLNVTADLIAKLIASVVVVVTNYFISKLFVFRRKRSEDELTEVD